MAMTAAKAEAAKLLRGLHLESVIMDALPDDRLVCATPEEMLSSFIGLPDETVDSMVSKATLSIAQCIKTALLTSRAAQDAKQKSANKGSKFAGELRGGGLDVYFAGVTGIAGEPHTNLTEGVKKEHREMQDATIPFTTTNFGITTTPELEYKLVANFSGRSGEVELLGTRRCPDAGVHQQDRRTLRPISSYKATQALLTWVEIVTLVLYTGPMFVLYNGILRGFGFCGEVNDGIDFWSKDGRFETQCKKVSVVDRMKQAGHAFSSTVHALVSAVKKLQRTSTGVQGSWLYRGLDGLSINVFMKSNGFAEKAFMSTTENLEVALAYSGIKKGAPACVLAMELSEVDHGAVLKDFSQYPGEEETLWTACSFMEPLRGREEWRVTEWGIVKVVHVKMNSCGKAMTVEELEMRRQSIVVSMLHTLHGDLCRKLRSDCEKHDFLQKVGTYPAYWIQEFIARAEVGSMKVVKKYQEKNPVFFHDTATFAEAVGAAAALPVLAHNWVQCFLENKQRTDLGQFLVLDPKPIFPAASKDLRRLRLEALESARSEGKKATTRELLLTLAYMSGYLQTDKAESLDKPLLEGGNETALVEHSGSGNVEAVRWLLEAGANANLAGATEHTPLTVAAAHGHVGVTKTLLDEGADCEARGAAKQNPLHTACRYGKVKVAEVLLSKNADINATDFDWWTPLHQASQNGHAEVAQVLLSRNADIKATDRYTSTPLHLASAKGHAEVAQVLLSRNADMNATDGMNRTPLHVAHTPEVAQVLLSKNADIKATDSDGWTPLHCASQSGHAEVAQVLLSRNADVEATDRNTRTPLHLASEVGHAEVAQVLLDAHGDVNARSKSGRSPLDVAASAEVKQVLEAAGGVRTR